METNNKIQYLIVDTSAFIKNAALQVIQPILFIQEKSFGRFYELIYQLLLSTNL